MKWFSSNLVLVCGLVLLLGAANVASGAAPSNDNCSNAKAVGDVTNMAFNTTEATFDGPGHYINSPNVWYCYTATCTGCATISLAGSSFDTKLAVYKGCGCYPSLSALIKKNDDSSGQQSEVTIAVKAGDHYLIEIGGFNPSVKGQGVLSISCDALMTGPTNDNCDKAKEIGNVTDLSFSTICATFDGPGHFFTSPNLWYLYTAPSTGDVTVSLLGSEFDTALVVYDTSGCYPKLDDIIDRNDDFGGFLQSQITFQAVANQKYLFEVLGYNSDETGEGVLNVSGEGPPPPPPVSNNDDCHNAKAIAEVTNLPFDTTNATFDGQHKCMYSPNRWYCYTASCSGEVTVSLAGSSYDTMLAVYEGCAEGGDCTQAWNNMIECNDDTSDSRQSEIVFDAVAGNQYLIEVGGYDTETGTGFLTVSCEGVTPPSTKDDCDDAKAIGNVTDQPFDTTDATFDGPGLCMTSPNIWYCYTATCSGNVTVSLAGSSFDTMLAVYDGCECYPVLDDLIECNDDAGAGYQSAVTFAAVAGNQYLIEVGGYGSEKGEGLISISCSGVVTQGKTDLGDAPDSTNHLNRSMTAYAAGHTGLPYSIPGNFPTVYNDGSGTGPYGPVHLNDEIVAYLGTTITREIEADTGPDEDGRNNLKVEIGGSAANHDNGDDTIDLKTTLSLPKCCWTTLDYKVTVVDPNVDLWVNIWCDWNRDGDWDDVVECPEGPAPEWAVQNQFLFNLPKGLNTITTPAFLPWHPDNIDNIWFRITLSERPWKTGSNPGQLGNAGSGPQEKYLIGETEDYYVIPDKECSVCKDYDGDGDIDMDDLVFYTDQWMDQCP
jgi:hypothetical protein